MQRNISSLILEASKVFCPWCKYEHNSRTYIEWSVSAGNYRLIILLLKQCDNICSPSLQNIRSFLLIYFAITPYFFFYRTVTWPGVVIRFFNVCICSKYLFWIKLTKYYQLIFCKSDRWNCLECLLKYEIFTYTNRNYVIF